MNKEFILFLTDLHIGITPVFQAERIVKRALKHAQRLDGEVIQIVLLGDLGEHIYATTKCLELVRRVAGSIMPIAGTIGNHDLIASGDGMNGDTKYDEKFPAAFTDNDIIYLDKAEPIRIGFTHTFLIGNIGWYDCKAQMDHIHMTLPPEYWQSPKTKAERGMIDINIKWDRTDIEFAKECRDRLIGQIEAIQEDDDVQEIIVGTHHPVLYKEIKGPQSRFEDPILDVYFYHPTLGEELAKYPKVKLVVSGHVHKARRYRVGEDGYYHYTIDSNYRAPNYNLFEIGNYSRAFAAY